MTEVPHEYHDVAEVERAFLDRCARARDADAAEAPTSGAGFAAALTVIADGYVTHTDGSVD